MLRRTLFLRGAKVFLLYVTSSPMSSIHRFFTHYMSLRCRRCRTCTFYLITSSPLCAAFASLRSLPETRGGRKGSKQTEKRKQATRSRLAMLNKTGAGTQHPMHFSCAPARSHTDNKQQTNSERAQAVEGRLVRRSIMSNAH